VPVRRSPGDDNASDGSRPVVELQRASARRQFSVRPAKIMYIVYESVTSSREDLL